MSWRFPIAFQILFGLLIIATVLKLPESPRWLIMKGRSEEARDIFAALNGTTPNSALVEKEVKEIEDSLALSGRSGLKDLFTMGPTRNFHWATVGSSPHMCLFAIPAPIKESSQFDVLCRPSAWFC